MLPAWQRVREADEFRAARHGHRARTDAMTVELALRSSDSAPRAGVVVGRQVGGAVVRNRVRRRLRQLLAQRMPGLPAGSLLVARARPASAATSYSGLAEQLDGALAAVMRKARR